MPPGTVVAADGKCVVDLGGGQFVFAQQVAPEDHQEWCDRALADEARVLPLRRSAKGDRSRSWSSVAEESTEEAMADWPLEGPRSTHWCLQFLKKEGRTLELHHERFKNVGKLESSMWGVSEHKELCAFLTFFCLFDQIDPSNSAGCEAIFRRLQTIEFSYLEKVRDIEAKGAAGGRLTPEEQAIFGGLTGADSALMLAPSLLDFARSEAERSASLAKNLRKAREEREANKKK